MQPWFTLTPKFSVTLKAALITTVLAVLLAACGGGRFGGHRATARADGHTGAANRHTRTANRYAGAAHQHAGATHRNARADRNARTHADGNPRAESAVRAAIPGLRNHDENASIQGRFS